MVVLCRRSATLRTYAGDTSLPGGKVDPEDKSIEDTAVGVPLPPWFQLGTEFFDIAERSTRRGMRVVLINLY